MRNMMSIFLKATKGHLKKLVTLMVMLTLVACSEPTGMDVTFNSDTPDVYVATMSQLENQLTASQYKQLKRAINYINLNTTEFSSLNDFRASLHGSTPAKIVAQAEVVKQSKL